MADQPALLAFVNPSGSSGKTTLAAAIAHILARDGFRVLAWDLDYQANLTTALGGRRDTAGITQALMSVASNDPDQWPGVSADELAADLRKQILRTIQSTSTMVDLIAADSQLRSTVLRWRSLRPNRTQYLLADAIRSIGDLYDVVVMDNKGDLSDTTNAALHAAGDDDQPGRVVHAIGVATPATKLIVGINTLGQEIEQLKAEGVRVELSGVIPNQIRPRSRGADADDLYELMKTDYFADTIMPPVRGAANLEGAYISNLPVTAYDPNSGIAKDLEAVVTELRSRKVLP